jgi:hypothetical protein
MGSHLCLKLFLASFDIIIGGKNMGRKSFFVFILKVSSHYSSRRRFFSNVKTVETFKKFPPKVDPLQAEKCKKFNIIRFDVYFFIFSFDD